MYLNNNQFTGSIPSEIGNLTNLTHLFLSSNQLIGSIPPEIGNLTNLNGLYLGWNQLTGEIPESICDLNINWNNSNTFNISTNQLCPPYPSCIEDYVGEQDTSNCEQVWACTADDGTDGVELWNVCYSIENTDSLNLEGNQLTGSIPPEIGYLTNLTWLSLDDSDLTGSIPSEIGNLTNLIYLNLGDNNQLTGSIPSEIGNLTNLTYLNIDDSDLTGSIPSEIGNLINLNDLDLENNQLTGSIPPEIGNLTNLWMNLGGNQLSGIIPDEICNIENSYIFLYNNQLCPPHPSCIQDYLGYQDMCSCGIEDDDVVYLWGNCYSIEHTTYLNLRNSGLTGSIPPEIGNLTNLTRLYLNENQLAGTIPSEIGNLTNLTRLYLNENQLAGEIPPEIGNLTNLERLYLFDNELTGSIPPEIGNMTNLTRLWLYDNELTGEIPDSICNLVENNCYIDISNNQLCPPYPSCIEYYVGEQDTTNCGQVSIIDETLPVTYNLYNAYPNPFNPVTTLQYDLPEDAMVNITIYDMMGRIVSNLVSSQQRAGYKSIQWDATNVQGQPVSAGVYLYSIEAGEFRQTKKMILLK
jgi:Leucine-rich repeat (LRR) protein